jgi:uncharacterized membrane protein
MDDSGDRPRPSFLKVLDGIGVCCVITLVLLPLVFWSSIHGRVPTHLNFFGEADSWGGKGNLFILPVVGLFVFGLFSIVTGSRGPDDPFTISEEKAERRYAIARTYVTIIKVCIIAMLIGAEWVMIRLGMGKTQNMGWFNIFVLGAIAVIAIMYAVQAYRAS